MNTKSAEFAKEFVAVIRRDNYQRPVRGICPGHQGKQYVVDIERKSNLFVVQCKQRCKYEGERLVEIEEDCSAAQYGVCYHSLAFILAISEKLGVCTFFETEEQAQIAAGKEDEKEAHVVIISSRFASKKPVFGVFVSNKKVSKTN